MALYRVAGSKIYIAERVAFKDPVVLADFAGANWVEIKGWSQAGAVGDTQNTGTVSLISETRDRIFKTTRTGQAMSNVFLPMPNDPGQQAFIAAIESCDDYRIKIEWGANCIPEGEVTISVADPAVITWAGGHGLEAGTPIVFTPDGGTLPTGLTAATVYYVLAAGLTATEFSVAATPGGTAVETTAAGTATAITATAQPVGQTLMFHGQATDGTLNGGDNTAALLQTWNITNNSNILRV